MPRKPREERAGQIVHVWARGNDRQAIVIDEEDRRTHLSILGGVVLDRGWRCLAYCQMTNHFHVVVETPEADLGAGMCRVNGLYARAFNRRHGRRNHLFGAPYGHRRILTAEHLWYVVAYVALNPVRAGVAASADSWAWSSHPATIGEASAPRWLDTARLLEFYEIPGDGSTGRQDGARRRYEELVAAVASAGSQGFEISKPRGFGAM